MRWRFPLAGTMCTRYLSRTSRALAKCPPSLGVPRWRRPVRLQTPPRPPPRALRSILGSRPRRLEHRGSNKGSYPLTRSVASLVWVGIGHTLVAGRRLRQASRVPRRTRASRQLRRHRRTTLRSSWWPWSWTWRRTRRTRSRRQWKPSPRHLDMTVSARRRGNEVPTTKMECSCGI